MITKERFVSAIEELRAARELSDKLNDIIRENRKIAGDFLDGDAITISHEALVVSLLENLMDDDYGDISYFIYELNYGKSYVPGCISDANGNIDLSTAESLYDYLTSK